MRANFLNTSQSKHELLAQFKKRIQHFIWLYFFRNAICSTTVAHCALHVQVPRWAENCWYRLWLVGRTKWFAKCLMRIAYGYTKFTIEIQGDRLPLKSVLLIVSRTIALCVCVVNCGAHKFQFALASSCTLQLPSAVNTCLCKVTPFLRKVCRIKLLHLI